MRYSISNTAEYGDLTRGNVVVNDEAKAEMKKILARIQDGSFAKEWIEENKKGGKNFAALREKEKQHPIEKVGEQLRAMMSWLPTEKKKAPRRQNGCATRRQCVVSSQFPVLSSQNFRALRTGTENGNCLHGPQTSRAATSPTDATGLRLAPSKSTAFTDDDLAKR
jgi:hypothetical protein